GESKGMRNTMTNNYWFRNTQNRCSAMMFKIKPFQKLMLNSLCFGNVIEGFSHFKHNISCKAITDKNIGFINENIAAFSITNKMNRFIFFKQRKGSLGQNISFFFFFSDIDKGNPGT